MSSEWIETVYGAMPFGLNCAKLGELCVEGGVQTGPFGSQLHQEDYVESGTPIITVEHLGENRIVHANLPKVSDEDRQRLAKYTLKCGDIVFSRVGSVDRRALVQQREDGWLFSGRCLRVRPQTEILDSQWLSYFFGLPSFKNYIRGIAVGATMPSLNTKLLSDVPIYFPCLDIQRQAAIALSALDDRITLLRETNATLEAIAQAIFKSWFVDFDPVRAKQEGRAPEGMDETTAALFPDSFEESELGLVPRGWGVEWLSNVFDFKEGPGIRNWQYTNSDVGTRFINIRCIQDGDLSIETANRITDEEANGKYAHFHLKSWDVVVSTSGTLGRSAIVREDHLPLMLNTSVIRFRPVEGMTCFSYVYEYLNTPEFMFKVESMASGSVQKNFGPMHLKQMKLVLPPIELIVCYESAARPLFEKIVTNRARAQTLAALRDTLLPRLISGQLRLPDAEDAIAEVVA
jgi:type I restriction enzyme S subunit